MTDITRLGNPIPGADRADQLDRWRICAIHEAGHADAYMHFGWKFDYVRIFEENGVVQGAVRSLRGDYDCFARAISCLAGPLAETMITRVPWDEQPASWRDREMAEEALAKLNMADLDIESVVPYTEMLVAHDWDDIQRIARALLNHKRLSFEEVRRLGRYG